MLDRGKRVANNYQKVQQDYEHLLGVWETARELMPSQKEMEGLLKNITIAGQKSGVTFLLFKPLDPVEHDYYFEHPIQIKTSSKYHELGVFLAKVAYMDRMINIKELQCNGIRPKRGEKLRDTVQGDMQVIIYVFKDLAARMKPPQI